MFARTTLRGTFKRLDVMTDHLAVMITGDAVFKDRFVASDPDTCYRTSATFLR